MKVSKIDSVELIYAWTINQRFSFAPPMDGKRQTSGGRLDPTNIILAYVRTRCNQCLNVRQGLHSTCLTYSQVGLRIRAVNLWRPQQCV